MEWCFSMTSPSNGKRLYNVGPKTHNVHKVYAIVIGINYGSMYTSCCYIVKCNTVNYTIVIWYDFFRILH